MRREITKTIQSFEVTCDLCGMRTALRTCCGCGKDLCESCVMLSCNDLIDGALTDSSFFTHCKRCEELSGPFHEAAKIVTEECDRMLAEIRAAWQSRCKEPAPTDE
jgi:hypothetical protein